MPRVYPRKRTMLSVRIGDTALVRIDVRAAEAGLSRSAVLRAMLAYADQAWPAPLAVGTEARP